MAAEFCLRNIAVTCRKSTTWVRRLCYGFLSPLKIHQPRPGSNPRTLGPVASTLTTSTPRATVLTGQFPYCLQARAHSDYTPNLLAGPVISLSLACNI
jgi:hypothetical protein